MLYFILRVAKESFIIHVYNDNKESFIIWNVMIRIKD